jgi:undecaprenyl-diphosphatase
MTLIEAIILGLIQGFTEFLPVSSSGHLELGKYLFGIDPGANFYFSIAVHGSTVLSTIVVFRRDISRLFGSLFKFKLNEETKYILKLIISMIPVGVVGLFLKQEVEAYYNGNMVLIGSMLLVTSLLLTIGHFAPKKERNIGFFDAFILGIAQAFAVMPGISRSGATISTGLILGNRKDEIARFSFLMVLVPVLGANFLEFFSDDRITGGTSPFVILAGSVAAFISGYFACKWMINLVKRSKMIWFALYCTIIGLLTIFFL